MLAAVVVALSFSPNMPAGNFAAVRTTQPTMDLNRRAALGTSLAALAGQVALPAFADVTEDAMAKVCSASKDARTGVGV